MLRDKRVSSGSGKEFVKYSVIENTNMRLESGTCNVCSAPCSSCMHLNHALKRPKAEDFFDENCRVGEANNNHCSVDEGSVSSLRSKACESSQHAISETSNIIGITSSHDSLSENAESGQTLSNKYKDSKSVEVPDENNSCISRASYTYLLNNSQARSNDVGSSQRLYVQSRSDKFLSGDPSLMHRERDLCSHVPEMSECSVENSNSSLTKKREPIVDFGEKSIANKDSLVDCTAEVSPKVCSKSEADSDNDVCDVKDEDRDGSVRDRQHEKTEELVKSPGGQEPQSEHESDRSDPMENDVQSCDICGDAGREDQLAICSRCSDGAEHIYCMRVMLQKVPEGDWLCEECQYEEDTEKQRQDVEEKKSLKVSSSSQDSRKRISENIEIAPAAKRQALESSSTSPKMSSPKKLAQLSRESSFKSLDKGKVKPCHKMPTRNRSGSDDKEIARSLSIGPRDQPSKSTLLKSSSFNNSNSKPRVKLLDEVAPPKPKWGGEHTFKPTEMSARMTSKSTLLKSPSLGHSNATESKVKMISPTKSATSQELKGSRHSKESGGFDRKLLSRIDRSVACSSMATSVVSTPKGDQKLKPRGETIEPSAVNNNRDLKDNLDGKFSILSKLTSNISRKSLEPQVSSETMSTSVDEALQEVLPQSPETENQDEKTRDSSRNRMTLAVTAASKSRFCHKCKEFDHSTECCTAGSTNEPGAELSVCNSKEEMHKGNKLKEAIQMALLRRPEIYKMKEVPSQTDELSTLRTDPDCEVSSQDQVLVSDTLKNSISADETLKQQEIPENSTSGSSKCLSANYLKQLNSFPTDFCYQPGSDSLGLTAGKPVVRDLSNKALAISSVFSRMLAIPEYDYIWQGVFEVHRNGKPPDACNGIQAHLSSCASPKVLEAVNKFLPKLPLDEVSRLSTWPSQFHQGGAKEYNIALYFFAKDIESYERHYKGLLDHMIRNDLALKGKFDGVELLIFPSNQLPENSQSWNMLFFLWGIFRVTRTDHLDSAINICIPSLNAVPAKEDSSTAVLTLSEMHFSPKPVDEVSIASGKACSEFPSSTSVNQGQITVCVNVDINDLKHLGSQGNLEKQDSRIISQSTSAIPTSSTLLFQEMKSTGPSQKDGALKHQQCGEFNPPEAFGGTVSSRIVETKTDCDISVSREKVYASNIGRDNISKRINSNEDQQSPKRKQKKICHYIDLEVTIGDQEGAANNISKDNISARVDCDDKQQTPKRKQKDDCCIDVEATIGGREEGAASNIGKDKIPEKMVRGEDQQCPKRKQEENDHYIDLEATLPEDRTIEEVNCQLLDDKVVRYVDPSGTTLQAPAVIFQKVSLNEVNGKYEDGGSSSKKLKTGLGGIYASCSSGGRDSFNDNFTSLENDIGTGSSVEDEGCEEACDERSICGDLGLTERTLFPVSGSQLDLNRISLKGPHEYRDGFQHGFPNLDLVLGGKTEPPPPPKGMLSFLFGEVDKKNIQEKHPDMPKEPQEEDVDAASLSLSLAFPSSNKEQKKTISKAEVLPDGQHRVNTPPFLLFGRFTDK
ncbi:putative chromatin regulator PHD family [Lupinus albus]|uniref:Putative chromatin regulator PHD family n=1 Tax=Lupinus albus TaxID=3870 RepID=A0A6A4P4S0_LUPAL|nr:putative chromatin regulator PHD family [Lupinus albus]